MGTNYYAKDVKSGVRTHVGKSSAGWQFCFREKESLNTVADWFDWLETQELFDEYGGQVSLYCLCKKVLTSAGSLGGENATTSDGVRSDGVATFYDFDFC